MQILGVISTFSENLREDRKSTDSLSAKDMPNKTVIVIHGGDAYLDYEQYLVSLKQATVDPFFTHQESWRKQLPETLGEDFTVITPRMPCKENARYNEWKIWFEKYLSYTSAQTHLVGHSLGAMFLVRYCSENVLPKGIVGVHLVAGGYTPIDKKGKEIIGGGDFYAQSKDLINLEKLENCNVYHSEDDPVVPYECATFLLEHATKIQFNSFVNRGHFLQKDFSELVANIKGVV